MNKTVLACITAQEHCISIVESAKSFADSMGCDLKVLTIQPKTAAAQSRSHDIKVLNDISKRCGIDLEIHYSDNPTASISKRAVSLKPIHIFIGEDNGFLSDFRTHYGLCPISMVSKNVVCTIPPEIELVSTDNDAC